MAKTKILVINYEYPPVGGGTAKACEKVIEHLVERDVEIHVLTSSPSSYSSSDTEGLKVERLNVYKDEENVWRFPEVFWFILKASYRTRKLAKKQDFDLVHAWTGFPCGLVARTVDRPYIVSLRGGDVPGFDERFNLFYPFLKPLIKNIWKNAEMLVPNSSGLKELAQQTMQTEMRVIPNGVDTRKFYGKKDYGFENGLRLVTVARLTEMKKVSDMIKAVSTLEDVQLDIIGTGKLEDELKEQVKDFGIESRVDFKGYIENEGLPSHLTEADVFVLPSLNEGMSNATLEAMASGLPIIITDVGGSDELVDGNGFIVEKENPQSISEAIKNYFDEPGLLERHGRRSREIVESRNWEAISDKFYKTYMKFKA